MTNKKKVIIGSVGAILIIAALWVRRKLNKVTITTPTPPTITSDDYSSIANSLKVLGDINDLSQSQINDIMSTIKSMSPFDVIVVKNYFQLLVNDQIPDDDLKQRFIIIFERYNFSKYFGDL